MTVRALALIGCALLVGCGTQTNTADLERFVAQVKARPGGDIEPVPVFENYEPFVYEASVMRSPFQAPIDVQVAVKPKTNPNIKPNLNRSREYLEGFSLDSLSMVGILAMNQRGTFALVSDPEGQVSRVRVGNFMGNNYGRIDRITESFIELTEIVPDGGDGWIERPRTLALKDPNQ